MAATTLSISAQPIEPGKVYIIAEIGVNHDGSLDRAINLIEAAKRAGADAVKFQLFNARALLSRDALLAQYQQGQARDPFEMLEALQLDVKSLAVARDKAQQLGLHFIVTPFSLCSVEEAAGLGVDAIKIASPDCVNTPLLRAAKALGKPLIVSTGAATHDEVESGLDSLSSPEQVALLACVSSYPTELAGAALADIALLQRAFAMPVGYSDHTREAVTGALAVAAGATILEKHLTYDTGAPGPDHAASLDPDDFAEYVRLARLACHAMAPATRPLPCEMDVRQVSRQSVCAARDLPAGHILREADLAIMRPGTGIAARFFDQVVGCTLKSNIDASRILQENQLEGFNGSKS
jgi:sialic acid synthase SpsE